MLSASGNFSFAEYASFLMRYPDWPNSDEMRNKAEQAINPLSLSPSQVVAFFDRFPPLTNAGRARFAIALHASGDTSRAEVQAREAWRGGALNDDDEARMFRIAGNRFTSADHDARVDRLLWSGSTRGAERWIAYTSPQRRPAFIAALATRLKAADADQKVQDAGSLANSEASLIAARADFMRSSGNSIGARELLANRANLAAPVPVLKDWYQLLLTHAQAAAKDGQYDVAYRIASRVDDATPRGLIMVDQDIATRDRYTSLTWLAGMTAMERLGRPDDAVAMFERYASAAKSAQTRSKGLHFAGKAAAKAGDQASATRYHEQAAAYYESFFGQLSLEQLRRPLPPVPRITPAAPVLADGDVPAVYLAAALAPMQNQLNAMQNQMQNQHIAVQNQLGVLIAQFAVINPVNIAAAAARSINVIETARRLNQHGLRGVPYVLVPLGDGTPPPNWPVGFDRAALVEGGIVAVDLLLGDYGIPAGAGVGAPIVRRIALAQALGTAPI
jgi:soluble lytic murein transglycosylase